MNDGRFFWVALAGALMGGFLNRVISRLGLQKSLVWPMREHCPSCVQPLPWRRALPIVGDVLSWGRCPHCKTRIGIRKTLLELLTLVLFVGLFALDVKGNGEFLPRTTMHYFEQKHFMALFVYHAALVSFLIAASVIDLDWMIIPDSVTIPGMIVGLALGSWWYVELHPIPPWNLPPHPAELFTAPNWDRWLGAWRRYDVLEQLRAVIEPHWRMNWNRWTGLIAGLMGMLAGGSVVVIVRAICTWAFGREAMGLGDATLMAMVGAFLGWQSVLMAFFLAPLSAIVVGIGGWMLTGKGELPYGPHLALASLAVVLWWRVLWAMLAPLFLDAAMFWMMVLTMAVGLAAIALLVAWTKRFYARLAVTRA